MDDDKKQSKETVLDEYGTCRTCSVQTRLGVIWECEKCGGVACDRCQVMETCSGCYRNRCNVCNPKRKCDHCENRICISHTWKTDDLFLCTKCDNRLHKYDGM